MNWQQISTAYEANRGAIAKIYRSEKTTSGNFWGATSVVMTGNVLFLDDLVSKPYMAAMPLVEIVYWNEEYVAIPAFFGIKLPYVAERQRARDWSWKGNFIYSRDESYPFSHPIRLYEEWSEPYKPDPFMLLNIMRLDNDDFRNFHFGRMQLYRHYVENCSQYDSREISVWRIMSNLNKQLTSRSHIIRTINRRPNDYYITIFTGDFAISGAAPTPRAAYQEAYNRAFRGF